MRLILAAYVLGAAILWAAASANPTLPVRGPQAPCFAGMGEDGFTPEWDCRLSSPYDAR